MNAYGAARTNPLSIAYYREQEGALWLNRKVLISPRLEIRARVEIGSGGCWNPWSNWAMDGFVLTVSKSTNYLNGGGGALGYNNIFDAIVTEIDLYQNPGDLSANSVSVHKCFGTYCQWGESSNTIQRNLPFNYDLCRTMVYDVSIQYTTGAFNVMLGDTTLLSVPLNLSDYYQDNWAYVGFSGFFRGYDRSLSMSDSYVCEDDFDANNFYVNWLVGGQFLNTADPVVKVGQVMDFRFAFVDSAGLKVPHCMQYSIWEWKVNVGTSCSSITAPVPYDNWWLQSTVRGCNQIGKQYMYIQTNKGQMPLYFRVDPGDFTRLFFIGYGNNYSAETSVTRVESGVVFFNWGTISGNFAYWDLYSTGGLQFLVYSSDYWRNEVNFGMDANKALNTFGINVTTNSMNIPIRITPLTDSRFKVTVPVFYTGTYTVRSNYFPNDDGNTRFNFVVYPSPNDLNKNSICKLQGYSMTPILDTGVKLTYVCDLRDVSGNGVSPSIAMTVFKYPFGAALINADTGSTVVEVNPVVSGDQITFTYVTQLNGTFYFSAFYSQNGTRAFVSYTLNRFTVIGTPKDLSESRVWNYTGNSFATIDPSSKTANVSYDLNANYLTYIDFIAAQNTFYSSFRYPDSWNQAVPITGFVYNTHSNDFKVALQFEVTTIQGKPYVGVYLANKATLIRRTSYPYTLELNFSGTVAKIALNVASDSFNGIKACHLPLALTNSKFFETDYLKKEGMVDSEWTLAKLMLATTDKEFYNYKLPSQSKVVITVTPPADVKTSLRESVPDGTYSVLFYSKLANTYSVSVSIEGTVVASNLSFKTTPKLEAAKIESSNLNTGLDKTKTTPTSLFFTSAFTNDIAPKIYFNLYDDCGNLLSYDYLSTSLGLSVWLEINKTVYLFPMDSYTVVIRYDTAKGAYALTDNYKVPGDYVMTITTKAKTSITLNYSKTGGAVWPANSSGVITSNKNINVSQTATVSLTLRDSFQAIAASNDDLVKAIVPNLNVFATAADSSVVAFKFVEFVSNVFKFVSDPIMKQSTYTLTATFTDSNKAVKSIPIADNLFNVNYVQFDITKCKLSAVLSKTVQMSTNSILQVNNQQDKPLFNFDFYDQNNVQLQYVDKSSKLAAVFTGSNLNINLNLAWIGTNQVMWTFPDSVSLANITGGKYALNILFKDVVSQTYTLQFLGDGNDSDAGNGDPNFDNTFFSSTDVRPTAGLNTNFNIEFRTAQNLRVNNYGDLTLFSFSNSLKLPATVFKVTVQNGAKKGGYIITVNSTTSSSSAAPIVLTISYNGNVLKQKVNVIVKCADLASIVVDPNSVQDATAKTLKSVKSVEQQTLVFTAYDKFNNNFDDLYNSAIFSSEKIASLLSFKHSANALLTSTAVTNPVAKTFSLTVTSKSTGTVTLSSSFIRDTLTYTVNPGPLAASFTYGQLVAPTITMAGSSFTFRVFPRDENNNGINKDGLSALDYSAIGMNVVQPRGVNPVANIVKSSNASLNTVDFTFILVEAGLNSIKATVNNNSVSCNSCSVTLTPNTFVFSNSVLTNGQTKMTTTGDNQLDSGSIPYLSLTLYDSYLNLLPSIPSGFALTTSSFGGNNANVTLSAIAGDNKLTISPTATSQNLQNWMYLVAGTGYFVSLSNSNSTLVYPVSIKGGSNTNDASNGPLDVSRTSVEVRAILTFAGVSVTFMIELRANDGRRKNFWYTTPNDQIKVSFSKAAVGYQTDVSVASKPGQYFVKLSSTMAFSDFDNNQISVTIEGTKCATTVKYIVSPDVAAKGYFIDSQGNALTRLPTGNADTPYSVKLLFNDKYGNVADLSLSQVSYSIAAPSSKTVSSTLANNGDKTFTININAVYAGSYTVNVNLVDTLTFNVTPGQPVGKNSLAKVPSTATAGETIKVYILPFDANNNYIQPTTIPANNFLVSYTYKDHSGVKQDYVTLSQFSVSVYPDTDVSVGNLATNSTLVAFAYEVRPLYSGMNEFLVTLGASAAVKCINCMTNVNPGKMIFEQSSFARYDSVSGSFMSLTTLANEDNSKTDIIYRLSPRDNFKNAIEQIADVSLFSLTLYDKKGIAYYLKRSNAPDVKSSAFVEFVKDDKSVKNPDLTYNTLTGGAYTASFNNSTAQVNRTIILIGRPGDEVASNEEIEVQNTVINESKLSFTAGQTGSLILELRTVNNLRKNNWNQNVTVGYQILDNTGKESGLTDKSFVSTVRNAGVLGNFYATVTSTLSTTSLGTNKLVLQIKVNGVVVKSLSPVVTVLPGAMTKANVMAQYIQTGSNNLLDGTADTPRIFKVAAFDSFGNPSPCDPLVLKLSASDPNGNPATITAARETTTGLASYVVDNKIAGKYTISSDSSLLPTYYFTNKNGKLSITGTQIALVDKTIPAGGKAKIKITPRDQFSNLIPPNDVQNYFDATVSTPSGKTLKSVSSTESSDIVLSTILTEKGNNVWNLLGLSLSLTDKVTVVSPSAVYANNTLLMLSGSETPFLSGAELSRNNKEALSCAVVFYDAFNNQIDNIPTSVGVTGAVISGNNMKQIVLSSAPSQNNDKFLLSVSSADSRAFNHLVSGFYTFAYTLNLNGVPSVLSYKLKLLSDFDDSGYGNGISSVDKTTLSHATVNIPAGSPYTINMRLKTAQGLYFNDDIDVVNDVKYTISTVDPSFTFKVYKKGVENGNYNIDLRTNMASSSIVLTISLRDPENPSSFKQLPGTVLLIVKPALPSKAIVLSSPDKTITAGTPVVINFKISDPFGNIFTKNSDVLSNLVLTNGVMVVSKAVFTLKSDGLTYSVSYLPTYPPRAQQLNINYKDAMVQSILLQNPIETYVVSEAYFPNSIVTGSNLNAMPAGSKLSLSAQFYDKNNACIENIDNIQAYATVNGPLERMDSSVINYQYRFNVTKASSDSKDGCGSTLVVNVPDNQIYSAIGSYKINVYLGDQGYLGGSFTQKVVPDVLDLSKFVSKFNMLGDFDPGRIRAGTEVTFSIQGNDKFMNAVTASLSDAISLKLKAKDGSIAKSSADVKENFDYEISMVENTPGLVSVSLKIIKADSFLVQYFYKGNSLSAVNVSKGPFYLTVIPAACSASKPIVNIDNLAKAATSQPTTFDITCKDAYNNPITVGGEAFRVNLNVQVLETKTSSNVKSTIADNNDGTYRVQFVPPLAGQYSLLVDLNGRIYYQYQFDVKDNSCPADKPNRCPNNFSKCVANAIECLTDRDKCPKDTEPFYCKVNGVDSCVASKTACDCSTNYIRCEANNSCMPADKADLFCPFSLPVSCAKLYPKAKVFCPDGICRSTLNDTPAQRVCPIGSVLCPDMTCRSDYSKCANYEDCPKKNMIRCSDMSCAVDQKDCPSSITCSRPGMYVCPDGSCVTSEVQCKPLPQCVAPNTVLCADNSCVADIKNCPKQVSCGHGNALCSDIICRPTCLA